MSPKSALACTHTPHKHAILTHFYKKSAELLAPLAAMPYICHKNARKAP